MGKPLKIFIFGMFFSGFIVIAGIANVYRLDSKVLKLQELCVEKDSTSEYAEFAVMVCDADSLSASSNLVGIQFEISEAHREARQFRSWLYIIYIFSFGVVVISVLPLGWYFFLARIRELRDAIAGKKGA